MNILIVGGLGHNGSRLKQFHYRGCRLTYLSTFYFVDSLWDFQDNTMNYEHFRDKEELYREGNFDERVYGLIKQKDIDIIYCMLNHSDGSNEFAKRLIDMKPGVPIVRHYKEHACRFDETEKEVLLRSDGQIYENIESLRYFRELYGVGDNFLIALGDPPQYASYLPETLPPLLSEQDGQVHVASFSGLNMCGEKGPDLGRYALEEVVEVMLDAQIHVHLHGNIMPECRPVYDALARKYPDFCHLHGFVDTKTSCGPTAPYDWGLIYSHAQRHWPYLENEKRHFNRLNSPGKMARYIAAGVPFFVKRGIYDFMERMITEYGIGFAFDDYEDLVAQLKDRIRWRNYRQNLTLYKDLFSMEAQADKMLYFFRAVIERFKRK